MRQTGQNDFISEFYFLSVLQLLVICGAVVSEVKLLKYHTAVISTKCCDLLFGFIWKMMQKKKYSVFQLQWDKC